jgi:hypothetical protein
MCAHVCVCVCAIMHLVCDSLHFWCWVSLRFGALLLSHGNVQHLEIICYHPLYALFEFCENYLLLLCIVIVVGATNSSNRSSSSTNQPSSAWTN